MDSKRKVMSHATNSLAEPARRRQKHKPRQRPAKRGNIWSAVWRGMLVLTIIAALGGGAALYVLVKQVGPPPLANADIVSVIVVDRNDKLLRAFTTPAGRWRLPVKKTQVDQRYLKMLMAYEDRRFYDHHGIDPLAVIRAGWLLVRHGRLVSGASTLTMQAARLLDGVHERTLAGKIRQMIRAFQLEQRLSKTQIMELYLKLAPMGGNIEGVRAASLAYFGKEPKRLSIGEAALLVAIPQSPAARRPDRHWRRAKRARNRVLLRIAGEGVISLAEAHRAMSEPVPRARKSFPLFAPHLSERERGAAPRQSIHRLTIDRDVQMKLEKLAFEHVHNLGSRLSAALLVVDHRNGQILAHIGAADYLNKRRFGGIDMVRATRSPGSTLKPFIYGLAFDAGLAHPDTLIEDRAVRYGSYAPKNFDKKFHGTVTVRTALAQSLNIPAVKLLHGVGPSRLIARFKGLGTLSPLPASTQPTLALALGGVGLKLSDLAALYASLAQAGRPVKLSYRRGAARASTGLAVTRQASIASSKGGKGSKGAGTLPVDRRVRRLMSPVAAWYVTDILKDAPPPVAARKGLIAYKTGTSYGFRDAWAAGYDGRYTIVAWVGRPDGASTPNLTGRIAAAPLLFDAFSRVNARRAPFFKAPKGVIVARGVDLPPPLKRFSRGGDFADAGAAQGPFKQTRLRIAFPPDRVDLELEFERAVQRADNGSAVKKTAAERAAPILLKAQGGALPLTWLVNGRPINSSGHRRSAMFTPQGRGFVKLSVIDARGRVDRVTVRLR